MMTQKDFTKLADALSRATDIDDAIHQVAAVRRDANPRFNPVKFYAAVRDGQEARGE